jgi:hypothetical protein
MRLGRYGMFIVVLLVATGFFRYVLVPLISASVYFITLLFSVPAGLFYVQRAFHS